MSEHTQQPSSTAPISGEKRPETQGRSFGTGQRGRGPRREGGQRRTPRREERAPAEFEQKIIDIRRVTRVVAGGRRFAFSVALVIGDKRGRVGVGLGKAGDTSLAIQKAFSAAKKNMIRLCLTETQSLPHDSAVKYSSARIMLMPNSGRGLVAGSSARNVLALAGITDVTAKITSPSKNKLNIARATLLALKPFADKDFDPRKAERRESFIQADKA